MSTRKKIFNDPVYGFIPVADPLLLGLIEHPWLQRLSRIRQLGLAFLVYPGAGHTRFHHALGALHLVTECIASLRSKGVKISKEEERALSVAILLHDIGHGPFSHALEGLFIRGVAHERLTEMMFGKLNGEFKGAFEAAAAIYNDTYPKRFLHKLVASQLDMDRMDYLNRDSFYSGVSEGVVGYDRIIKMLNVVGDDLVVEVKGIYSIEKFLIARRLMYWQVYLHKTVLSAEQLLVKIISRARELAMNGHELFASKALRYFLYHDITGKELLDDASVIWKFARLDDTDLLSAIKEWMAHDDFILQTLSRMLIDRRLFKIRLQHEPIPEEAVNETRRQAAELLDVTETQAAYFAFAGEITNNAYSSDDSIHILYKDGSIKDIAEASDLPNISVMSTTVTKYFLCAPRGVFEKTSHGQPVT